MAFSECVVLHADVLDAFDTTIWNQTTKNSFSKFDSSYLKQAVLSPILLNFLLIIISIIRYIPVDLPIPA